MHTPCLNLSAKARYAAIAGINGTEKSKPLLRRGTTDSYPLNLEDPKRDIKQCIIINDSNCIEDNTIEEILLKDTFEDIDYSPQVMYCSGR